MGLSTVSAFKNIDNNDLKVLTNSQLKKLQSTLLSIVKDFDKVCKKNNIEYSLGGGTCLGAIRHNGFIPWDDDMDLNLTRTEYNKFRKVFKKELSEKYWLTTPEDTKEYGLGFARLRKKHTIYKSREDKNNDQCGIYIDLFIIENTYNNIILRYIHGFLSLLFGLLLSCKNFFINREEYLKLIKKSSLKIKTIFRIKIFIGFLLFWISQDNLTKAWNTINSMCKDNNSKYVTIPVGRKHFFKELTKRDGFCDYKTHIFEDVKLPICNDYKSYMKRLYGDTYMEIPSKEEQEKHVFYELKF